MVDTCACEKEEMAVNSPSDLNSALEGAKFVVANSIDPLTSVAPLLDVFGRFLT
jgi:hypothetical protein